MAQEKFNFKWAHSWPEKQACTFCGKIGEHTDNLTNNFKLNILNTFRTDSPAEADEIVELFSQSGKTVTKEDASSVIISYCYVKEADPEGGTCFKKMEKFTESLSQNFILTKDIQEI